MPLTLAQKVELIRRHSVSEAAGNMEATLATMERNPTYCMFPVGKKFTGLDNVRRYYNISFTKIFPRVKGYQLVSEWINDDSAVVEYTIDLQHDDGIVRRSYMMCKYSFGETGITGETMYTDEAYFRIFADSMWDDLEQI